MPGLLPEGCWTVDEAFACMCKRLVKMRYYDELLIARLCRYRLERRIIILERRLRRLETDFEKHEYQDWCDRMGDDL